MKFRILSKTEHDAVELLCDQIVMKTKHSTLYKQQRLLHQLSMGNKLKQLSHETQIGWTALTI